MEVQQFSITAHIEYAPESIDAFVDLCVQAIHSMTPDSHARYLLKTAVDELTLNALEHGYGHQSGSVEIRLFREPACIRFDILDSGSGVDQKRVRKSREARTEVDLAPRGWAFSILDKLTEGLVISSNTPHGAHVTLRVPLAEYPIVD